MTTTSGSQVLKALFLSLSLFPPHTCIHKSPDDEWGCKLYWTHIKSIKVWRWTDGLVFRLCFNIFSLSSQTEDKTQTAVNSLSLRSGIAPVTDTLNFTVSQHRETGDGDKVQHVNINCSQMSLQNRKYRKQTKKKNPTKTTVEHQHCKHTNTNKWSCVWTCAVDVL